MNRIKERALKLSETLENLYPNEHATTVAWWLLEKVTQKNKALLLVSSDTLTQEQETQLKKWKQLLIEENYPLQYILETVPFGSLELFVEPPTLIPRPETETWCANLIELLKKEAGSSCYAQDDDIRVLDMCTGSGCIGLWIAKELPHATVHLVDISEKAIALAQKNANHNDIKNIKIIQSDLFKNFDNQIKYDIIISNPPYVTENEWQALEPHVKNWEDKNALVADDNGLLLYKRITKEAENFLKDTQDKEIPHIVFEIGAQQAHDVQNVLEKAEYTKVEIIKDNAGKDRVVYGFK